MQNALIIDFSNAHCSHDLYGYVCQRVGSNIYHHVPSDGLQGLSCVSIVFLYKRELCRQPVNVIERPNDIFLCYYLDVQLCV